MLGELREITKDFYDLFENAPLGYHSLDENGCILFVNKKWVSFFGYSRDEVRGKRFGEFLTLLSQERLNTDFNDFKKRGKISGVEYEVIKSNGEHAIISLDGKISHYKNGLFKQAHCIFHDITEQKKLIRDLSESEEKFRTLSDQSLFAICIVQDDVVKYANQSLSKIFGYSIEEMKNWQPGELIKAIHPDDRDIVIDQLFKKQRGLKDVINLYDVRCINKEGKNITIEVFSKSINYKGGIADFITLIDITERKKAEQEKKESEEKYLNLVNNITDVIIEGELDGTTTFISPQSYNLLGYHPEELLGKKPTKFIHPEDLIVYAEKIKKALNSDKEISAEVRIRHKNGYYIHVSTRGRRIKEGEKIKLITVLRDITERKKMEEKLNHEQNLLQTLLENHPDFIYYKDNKARFQHFSKGLSELLRTSMEDIIGKTDLDLFPEEAAKQSYNEDLQVIKKGIPLINKEEFASGTWVLTTKIPWVDKEGNVKGLFGISRDITELKKAEQKLKESEEFFRTITEQSLIGITIFQNNKIQYINPQGASLMEYPREDMEKWTLKDILKTIHPEDKDFVLEQFQKIIQGSNDALTHGYYRIITKTGKIRYMDNFSNVITYKGKPAILTTTLDITEKKESEQNLKESEEKWEAITRNTPDHIIVLDKDFNTTFINYTTLDLSVEEVIGKSAFDNIPLEFQENVKKVYNNVFETGEPGNYELIYNDKEGNDHFFEAVVGPLSLSGEIKNLIVRATDITERKDIERKLVKSEAKWRSYVENAPEDIAVLDREGTILFVNRSHVGTVEETIGTNLFDHLTPDIQKIGKKYLDLVFETGRTYNFESYIIDPSGNKIWFENKVSPLKEGEEVISALYFYSDITDRKKAEEKLKESEEKYKELFNQMSSGVAVYDAVNDGEDFIFIDFNFSGEKIDNIKKEDLLGKSLLELFPGIKEFGLFDVFQRVWKTGKPQSHPITQYKDSRISGWRENYVYKLSSGEIVAVYDDITIRKQAEVKLKESEEKLKGIISSLPDLIFIIDINFNIIYANDVANKFYRKPLIGKTCYKTFHERSAPCTDCHVEKTLNDGKIHNRECERIGFEGKKMICSCTSSVAARDKNGQPFLAIEVSRDITDLRKAELKVKASEEKLQNLINNISDVLIQLEFKGEISYISPQITDIIEYQVEELIGQNIFKLVHPEDKTILQELMEYLKISREIINIDFRLAHRNGFYIPVSLKGTLVPTESNLTVIGVLRDMTERKRIEKMMKREVKQLKDLEQIRTDLINRISHEFNTPLVSIMSGSDLLLSQYKDKMNDDIAEIVDIINTGGYRLKDMFDNLLITYKIESNEIKANLKRKNIIPLLKLCIENIINQASKRGVLLNVELPNELFIMYDDKLINKVILNLLSNAIKNTPSKGNILVKTINHQTHVDIIFEDSGVGFTKKEMGQLFKKFGKIERYGRKMDVDIEGPGLGLYIANEIVKLHNGEILVKSKGRNKGSKIIVRLFKN